MAFVDQLGDLVDIALQDALILEKNPEDKEFLLAQCEKGRRRHMALDHEKYKRLKQAERKQSLMDKTILLTASEGSTGEEDIADGVAVQYSVHSEPAKNKKEDT